MHTSIKLDQPCEFINITSINPLISKCQIKVCYVGEEPNRNKSIITKEVAKQIANSLPGSPIVGFYNEDKGDFEEHNKIIEIREGKLKFKSTTRPYGFVDLGAKCWFQKFLDDGKDEREYLMTEGYLWTGQYPEAQRVINKGNNQSMELDKDTLSAEWSKDDKGIPKFFIINEAVIYNLCILGEQVEPCFEGSQITRVQFSFEDSFQEKLLSMMNELKEFLNKGGAQTMPDNSQVINEFENNEGVVVPTTDPVVEGNPSETEPSVEHACGGGGGGGASSDTKKKKKKEYAESEDGSKKKDEEEDICPKCGKPKSECTCENSNKKEDKKKQYNLDEIPEYVELSQSYETLKNEYQALKDEKAAWESTKASLESENSSLKEFKANAEREKKQQMIDSFYMLSDDDKADVTTNIDTYSLDDIEAKLSIICVRNKVSFNDLEEDNGGKAPTTYNLGSFEEDESTPAWVKAALSVAKEMNN